MNGTETIVSSGIILDVGGFQALEEEGEVSAANITATTNATDSNATAVTTAPIPPAETGQENATTTAAVTTEEEEEQTTAIPAPLLE